jgi:putative transposase
VIKAGDLFSRRVVGWSMKAEAAGLVTDALVMAIWRRGKPDALLHQSDQGSRYTSQKFQQLLSDNGVHCSMSRSGNVWDCGDGELLLFAENRKDSRQVLSDT